MSLLDLQAPANVPEHVVAGVRDQLEFLAPKCGLAVTAVIGREAGLRIGTVEATAHDELSADHVWYRVGTPGRRCAALMIDVPAVARLAELFMGGSGSGGDRVPSALELSIVERRLGSLLSGFDDVLGAFGVDGHEVAAVDPADFNPEPHQVRAQIEVVIEAIAIPFILVLPASNHAVHTNAPIDSSSVFAEALRDIPLSVSIRFESVILTAEELDELEPGDVIRLEQPANASLVGIVDNHRVFTGRAGRHGRRLALEIFEVSQ
ncbi:MAG TPA: FliM/FliN family flagellar motor switch protein [Acidimicrobiales bacterium]|nr:FliM/FliN family flagellar motor switch protein [Acidimicrobiales bacterium]